MSFTPQAFLSNLNVHNGPAKASKFEVIIPIPSYLSTFVNNSIVESLSTLPGRAYTDAVYLSNNDPQSTSYDMGLSRFLSLQCEAAELPGKGLQTADVKIYGPIFKVPYQTQFNDITLSFLCTNDFYEKKLFDRWMEAIMPMDTNNLRYPKGDDTRYLTNLKIIQYDEHIKTIYAVECIDAFPVIMASQPLNWADEGFHKLTVQFTYLKYRTLYNSAYNIDDLGVALFGYQYNNFVNKQFLNNF